MVLTFKTKEYCLRIYLYAYKMSDEINWNLFKLKTAQIQGYIRPKSDLKDPETKSPSGNSQKIKILDDKIQQSHFLLPEFTEN